MNLIKYFQLILIFSGTVIIAYSMEINNVVGEKGIPSLKERMLSPRCGVADDTNKRHKRFVLGRSGWNKRKITYFIANSPSTISLEDVAISIRLALNVWAPHGKLHFTRAWDDNADIVIKFVRGDHGDSEPLDGRGNKLAHAYYPYDAGHFGGDVHFDNDEMWTTDPKGEGAHLFTVAAHELGHSLGFSHSPMHSSVMFFTYSGAKPNLKLSHDDILGMHELYIKRRLPGDDLNSIESPPTTEFYYPIKRFDRIDHKAVVNVNAIPPSLPDICAGKYDAVASFRNDIFIFIDQYIWRISEKFYLLPGYPILLHQMFPELPKDTKKIDAAYERPDGNFVIFNGNKFWVFDGTDFIENSPKPLEYYGLPKYVKQIDAVQNWAKNEKTYFYKHNLYWSYNEISDSIDSKSPKHMNEWRGVPISLDSATTWKGTTYFFKNQFFWKFDNTWLSVERSPHQTAHIFLGCPKLYDRRFEVRTRPPVVIPKSDDERFNHQPRKPTAFPKIDVRYAARKDTPFEVPRSRTTGFPKLDERYKEKTPNITVVPKFEDKPFKAQTNGSKEFPKLDETFKEQTPNITVLPKYEDESFKQQTRNITGCAMKWSNCIQSTLLIVCILLINFW